MASLYFRANAVTEKQILFYYDWNISKLYYGHSGVIFKTKHFFLTMAEAYECWMMRGH